MRRVRHAGGVDADRTAPAQASSAGGSPAVPSAVAGLSRWLLAGAVLVHLVTLYWPRPVNEDTGLPIDKLVHATIFAAVLVAAARAGWRPVPVAVVLALHAPLSEIVQGTLLARDGNVPDTLADLVGVALGWLLVVRPGPLRPRPPHRPADVIGTPQDADARDPR